MISTNKWYHRKVAEKAAKPCWICYKLSSSVLITPDDKDFFYICPGHLKDKKFCEPDANELASIAERKLKWDADQETKRTRSEQADETEKSEEKHSKKGKKEKKEDEKDENDNKDDGENKTDSKDGKGKSVDGGGEDASEKQKKTPAENAKESKGSESEDTRAVFDGESRIFMLQRIFFQMRIDRIRNAELAKKNRERLQTPGAFPSVPSGNP